MAKSLKPRTSRKLKQAREAVAHAASTTLAEEAQPHQEDTAKLAEQLVASLKEIDAQEAADDAEVDAQIARGNSVVKAKYKRRYRDRAREQGLKSKAAKRSNWDWLAQHLAAATLDKKQRLIFDRFEAVMAENGVDLSRWPNRSQGWQGRLRMTAGLALRTKIAECGYLVLNGEKLEAPAEFIAKHTN